MRRRHATTIFATDRLLALFFRVSANQQRPVDVYALFRKFRQVNAVCDWTPLLKRCVTRLRLVGMLQPAILLVNCDDKTADVLRWLWTQRTLLSPSGLLLYDVGDVTPLSISAVDAAGVGRSSIRELLLEVVRFLTATDEVSTIEAIRTSLANKYQHIQVPAISSLYDTLAVLVREGQLVCVNGFYRPAVLPTAAGRSVESVSRGSQPSSNRKTLSPDSTKDDLSHSPTKGVSLFARLRRSLSRRARSLTAISKAPSQMNPSSSFTHGKSSGLNKDALKSRFATPQQQPRRQLQQEFRKSRSVSPHTAERFSSASSKDDDAEEECHDSDEGDLAGEEEEEEDKDSVREISSEQEETSLRSAGAISESLSERSYSAPALVEMGTNAGDEMRVEDWHLIEYFAAEDADLRLDGGECYYAEKT